MNKSTKPLLLAAMMAVAGFAVAQPTAPTNDVKSGTQGGSGPSASDKASSGSMPSSRAEVKSQAAPMNPSTTTRAAVKAGTTPMKAGTDGGEGPTASKKALTSAERKAQRAEDSAARKARHAGKANNPPVKDGRSAL